MKAVEDYRRKYGEMLKAREKYDVAVEALRKAKEGVANAEQTVLEAEADWHMAQAAEGNAEHDLIDALRTDVMNNLKPF